MKELVATEPQSHPGSILSTSPQKIRTKRKSPNLTPRRVRLESDNKVYLRHAWTFWYDEADVNSTTEKDIKKIGTFNTVQGFWQFYNHLVDPSRFPARSNLRLFKEGVQPYFSHPQNENGGKWTIPCSKSDTGKVWIKIVLTAIGEQFSQGEDICGVVLSVRQILDNVILCNSNAMSSSHEQTTTQLRKLIDTNHILTYQPYNTCIRMYNQAAELIRSESSVTFKQSNNNDSTSPDNKHSRRIISSGNLLRDESVATMSHKKSSSFSSTQFPDLDSPSWKKHRKTKSDSQQKRMVIRTTSNPGNQRKSASIACVQFSPHENSTSSSVSNHKKHISSTDSQPVMKDNLPSRSDRAFSPIRIIALFVLFILMLSGYIFTPH